VPELPITDILPDGPVKTIRPFRSHITKIHFEHSQDLLAGSDQLLYRIEHHDLFILSQVAEQVYVGFLMNPRLKSTQIDGDPVRGLKIEGCKNPFPGSHLLDGVHLLTRLM